MDFFVPGLDKPETADTLSKMLAVGHRPIHTVTYMHEGNRFVATVDEERVEFARRTGSRGGYINGAEPVTHGRRTGSRVLLIARTPTVIEVYSEPPHRGWANPSLIGLTEVEQVTYFEDG